MRKPVQHDERRQFERMSIPETSGVHVFDPDGEPIGPMIVLGRGGMMVKTKQDFKKGAVYSLVIHDGTEGIKREVRAQARDISASGIGFQFEDLGPDAAVEVGVIIGKYYSAAGGR